MVPPLGVLPWVAIPALVHLAVLARFWFDTPILDDYDCILNSMAAMARADNPVDWFRHVFALQNEHRLAGTRLMPQVLSWLTGAIDFRVLMLTGTAFMFAVLAMMWAEFRDETSGPVVAAAALCLMQWSYNEALLMASAATAHLGVVFFAFGALFFALRPGKSAAIACAVGGVLATYSQANGLFVLPLAGAACLLLGRRRRGIAFLAIAAALWAMYFVGYARPPNHPSMLRALEDPVKTFQLFLIIIGGVVPMLGLAQLVGAAILAGLAWVTWKGLWRRHPTVYLWIVFVLVSAGTVAVARVGFGLHYGSRYSVNAALLMALLVFGIRSLTRPWAPRYEFAAVAAAAVVWALILDGSLAAIRERSFRGHLLVEVEPGSRAPGLSRFHGQQHPSQAHAALILEASAAKGWYFAPRYRVELPAVQAVERRPDASPPVGVMDSVTPLGNEVTLRGWTDIAAIVPGRKFSLHPAAGVRGVAIESLQAREDVAVALRRPETLLSGFQIVARYDSEQAARQAAEGLCLYVEAPGRPATEILRHGVVCR